jgi:hypothetical protein
MLASPARGAAGPLAFGHAAVELGGVERLGRAVIAGQLGQLAGKLRGRVTGFAAGQPLAEHGQGRRVARSACPRVSNPPRSCADLMNSSKVTGHCPPAGRFL